LLDVAPLRLGTRSKAERGYALAFDIVQPASKAGSFGITAEHVVDDVIALLVGSCWHHLLKNHTVAERDRTPKACTKCASPCAVCGRSVRCSVACIPGGQQ
jgi:inorganic triphosphatase YgiF